MFKNLQEEAYELKNHLEPDEKLIWVGVPANGWAFNTYDYFMIPFSILWAGFAFFWEFTAIASGAPIMFALFGVPFVLVGFYLLFGRFIVDRKRRKNTLYVLTNKRIIIRSGARNKTLKTAHLINIKDIVLKEKPNKTGTILFNAGPSNIITNTTAQLPIFTTGGSFSFEMIDDVAEVYKKVNNLVYNPY